VRSTGIFTGCQFETHEWTRILKLRSPRRILQSQRQIITSGAAPGSSYRRCPDAGSLKFPQTPLLVRFASARRGPVTAIFLLKEWKATQWSASQKNLADGVAGLGRWSKNPRSVISSAGKCGRAESRLTETRKRTVIVPRFGRSYIFW
jgi:hypothetical protein